MSIPLSVLDLSPISAGQGAARAVRDTVELAQLAEGLGYYRYWVAEHHNIASVASTAPEIMIGQMLLGRREFGSAPAVSCCQTMLHSG
jgi:alkanesulfonate monooxygenase SsuD/methylene tetrahydromethanopterin reductase-like flavin-dependent oxidoreductase (luciferase family)